MSKTIVVTEADIQALRVAQFTIKTGDPADDRAAADAFTRVLGGLGIERKAEPLASIEQPVNVTVQNFAGHVSPMTGHEHEVRREMLGQPRQAPEWYSTELAPIAKPRRGRPRKRRG